LGDYDVRNRGRVLSAIGFWFFSSDALLQLSSKVEPLAEYVKGGVEAVGSTCRYTEAEVLRVFINLVMRPGQKFKTADEIL
jgi:hypothetical protein